MKWEPWENCKKEARVLDIKEPPCKTCEHWKPQSEYKFIPGLGVEFVGIICCNSKEMSNDFSCYKEGH